jgi:hypothetical protein
MAIASAVFEKMIEKEKNKQVQYMRNYAVI